MSNLLVSVVAGAAGGFLGEWFLFSGPEAWWKLKRTFRFYRHKVEQVVGREKMRCPKCWSAEPEVLGTRTGEKRHELGGWPTQLEEVAFCRCRECNHRWDEVVRTAPLDQEEGDCGNG